MRSQDAARRVTIADVAKHAGVSTAAVSKVLRNAYGVSDGSLFIRTATKLYRIGYLALLPGEHRDHLDRLRR